MNFKINLLKSQSLLAMFCLIILIACDKHDKFKILEGNKIVFGNVKYIREAESFLDYKFGELQKGAPFCITEYYFDERTNLVKVKDNFMGTIDSVIYHYDDKNNLIEKIERRGGKKRSYQYFYKDNQFFQEVDYVDDGLVKKVTIENGSSKSKRKERHEDNNGYYFVIKIFDDNGNIIEENTYDSIGDGTGEDNLFHYNTKGLITYSSISYLISEPQYKLYDKDVKEYQYNAKNLMIYKKNDNHSEGKDYKYSDFDKNGNWLRVEFEESSTFSGISRCLIERTIVYFE